LRPVWIELEKFRKFIRAPAGALRAGLPWKNLKVSDAALL
jgi:hypothetical protein